jgi:hypothetical protein
VARVTIGFPTRVDVGVDVCVGVALGRGVCVGVAVGISVRVGVGVAVGMPLFVGVAVGGIGAGVRVSVGRTAVFVGSWVGGTRPRSSPDVHPASTDNATTETSFRTALPRHRYCVQSGMRQTPTTGLSIDSMGSASVNVSSWACQGRLIAQIDPPPAPC